MELFFEILKYTIPALIVFATAYFLLKAMLDEQHKIHARAIQKEAMKITLPMRLQAYERLTLLCDRIEIQNALLRIRNAGMSMGELRGALMLTVNQEFDHNSSQQLYVSETLWQILQVAKNNTLLMINQASEGLEAGNPDDEFVARLLDLIQQQEGLSPLQKAIMAIRTEAGQLF